MVLLAAGRPALHANSPDPIPSSMSGGGTSGSPAQYIIDTSDVNQSGSVFLGSSTSYNDLTIENGHVLAAGASSYVGNFGGNNNYLLVTGAGSKFTVAGNIYVGFSASGNTVDVTNGGEISAASSAVLIGFGSASNNAVRLSDFNSTLTAGTLSFSGSGGTLTITSSALAQVDGTLTVNSGNAIQLDGGFLAWSGDHTTDLANMVASGALEYSTDGTTYQTGDGSNFSYQYFAAGDDAGAQAFSGYSGLAGYTILTSVSPIPEPATDALGVGLLALGLVGWRRRRTRQACA